MSAQEAEEFLRSTRALWYQRFELSAGIVTPGTRDIPAVLITARVPSSLDGLDVLDIGTTNGGVAFEAERRGARRVIATDIVDPDVYGFSATAELLGSRVEFRQSSVYELGSWSERFDLVFFLGVLYHLRHPLLGLDAVHTVARPGATIVIETEVADNELAGHLSAARFFRLGERADDPTNWFAPTTNTLVDWCGSSGFEVEVVATWPPDAPTRALACGKRLIGPPEYLRVSYENPLVIRAGVHNER